MIHLLEVLDHVRKIQKKSKDKKNGEELCRIYAGIHKDIAKLGYPVSFSSGWVPVSSYESHSAIVGHMYNKCLTCHARTTELTHLGGYEILLRTCNEISEGGELILLVSFDMRKKGN